MVSLSLNLFVATIGTRIILPFLISFIPFAYVSGALNLSREIFLWALLASLILVAARIFLGKDTGFRLQLDHKQKIIISLVTGSVLGLLAGIVGIGGGVYLVPLIIMLNLGAQKEATVAGVVSLLGLISRLQFNSIDLLEYTPLIVSVVLGGFLGSYIDSFKYSAKTM